MALDLENILIAAAREGALELRRRFDLPRSVDKKGAIDIVTDADHAAEEIILSRLSAEIPNATIVAEESGESVGTGKLRLYVDPLDGTTNYAGGLPHFAVSIGAVDGDGLIAGVVCDPMREETFSATRGQGARLVRGEGPTKALEVTSTETLRDAILVTGFPYDLHSHADELLALFRAFLLEARAVRRFGSAALDLAWVAAGRFDGFWESNLKPWDVAAGILIAAEAGAANLDYAGGPARSDGKQIICANPKLAAEMVGVIGRV